MPVSSELLAELDKEINDFIENIQDFIINQRFIDNRIILLTDGIADGYEPPFFGSDGNIYIDHRLLQYRFSHIEDYNTLETCFSKLDILRCIYLHILSHEKYHFENRNIEASRLSNERRKLSKEEEQIVREEETSAEKYAITKSINGNNQYLVYISLLIESKIRNRYNNEHIYVVNDIDYHISDNQILEIIDKGNFSIGQIDTINRIETLS